MMLKLILNAPLDYLGVCRRIYYFQARSFLVTLSPALKGTGIPGRFFK